MKPTTDRGAAQQIIRALVRDGWGLTIVWDGEESTAITNETEALNAIFAVDMAHLHVTRGSDRGWVWFVLGNDPEEVAADWTVNLSGTLDPLTERWF